MHPETIPQQALLSPHLVRRMLGYGLLLLLGLGTVVAAVLWHDRTVRYRSGQEQVRAIAHGAERELRRELSYIERSLTGLASDARELSLEVPDRAAHLLALRISGLDHRNPELVNIGFSTSMPDLPDLRTTGSSPRGSAGRMRIGYPQKVEGVGWVVPLALPIPDAGGDQPSWVTASLRLGALERIAADLDLGGNGLATIMHSDGRMLVRSRDQARWVGTVVHSAALMKQLNGKNVGLLDLPKGFDGIPRIAAYRVLPDYPLMVVTAIARQQALQGWGTFALTAIVLGGLLAGAWLAGPAGAGDARTRQAAATDRFPRRDCPKTCRDAAHRRNR